MFVATLVSTGTEYTVGDVGQVFTYSRIVDADAGTLHNLTSHQVTLYLKAPSGALKSRIATTSTDGLSAEYRTVAGDLDEEGLWMVEFEDTHVNAPVGSEWTHTDKPVFIYVAPRLTAG